MNSMRTSEDSQAGPQWEDTWKRAPEVCKNVGVFKSGPCWKDIGQGTLGDCYFLAACASYAEFPERVKASFITKRINKCGIYAVIFNISGKEVPVLVDDHFAVNAQNKPHFARFANNKMWVPIMEKAWAKIHGSYWRCDGGYTTNAFQTFAGKPAYHMYHKKLTDVDSLWNRIASCDSKDYCIQGNSNGHEQGDRARTDGIVHGHAYSIISAHKFMLEDKVIRLLKLKNPWGYGEWNGEWSDKCDIWTDDLKKHLGWSDKDDGIFFMSFDNYLKYYEYTDFSMLTHDKVPKQQLVTNKMRTTTCEFTISRKYDSRVKPFAVVVGQGGPVLRHIRLPKDVRFNPSTVKI